VEALPARQPHRLDQRARRTGYGEIHGCDPEPIGQRQGTE
jgi:hypothetical protein